MKKNQLIRLLAALPGDPVIVLRAGEDRRGATGWQEVTSVGATGFHRNAITFFTMRGGYVFADLDEARATNNELARE